MNPYDKRAPDSQYQRLLKDVLEKGVRTNTQQEVDAITLIGPAPLHFKFANGFPIINERNMAPKESERLPVTIWWEPWVTEAKCKKRGLETGDLGPGSYGAAFHNFPTTDGKPYNQFKNIIEQIIEFPHLRTHFISPWIPQYTIRGAGKQQKVVVAPCHGWIHLRVLDGKLTLHMFQRSADVPVGVPANMVQYMALLMMIAQATGLEPYEYVHSFSDAHIYVDQVPAVETMLARQPLPLATMSLDKTVQNIFDFRKEHFSLNDYNPHPGIKGIPVAI